MSGERPVPYAARPNILTGAVVAMHYESPLREAIMRAKYSGDPRLARWLGEGLVTPLFPTVDCITFVPLHRRRQWWRGYNQSQEIGKALARERGLPYRPLLRRVKMGKPQSVLSRRDRLENAKNAFVSIKNDDLEGKRVALVDDVLTTGATLDACASALRAGGARQVWGLVLARHR